MINTKIIHNLLMCIVILGLGRGCGAVIGGFFVKYFGTTTTFRGYGRTLF